MDTNAVKKSENREKKEQLVAELVTKLDNSNGLVFADYQGLTHKQLEDLKKELKKLDSTIVVAKNSLLKLSLKKSSKYSEYSDNEGLNQPTATLFLSGDMIEPLKKLQKTIKDLGLPKIKFGILEGQLVDDSGVLKLASLPNRETLLAQLVGTLNSPITGLVLTLNANLQKFVIVLNEVAKTKPAALAAAEPVQADAPATSSEPAAEQVAPETAEEPAAEAAQPDAPVETDESADAGTEEPSAPTETDTQTESEPEKTEDEGGEDK